MEITAVMNVLKMWCLQNFIINSPVHHNLRIHCNTFLIESMINDWLQYFSTFTNCTGARIHESVIKESIELLEFVVVDEILRGGPRVVKGKPSRSINWRKRKHRGHSERAKRACPHVCPSVSAPRKFSCLAKSLRALLIPLSTLQFLAGLIYIDILIYIYIYMRIRPSARSVHAQPVVQNVPIINLTRSQSKPTYLVYVSLV